MMSATQQVIDASKIGKKGYPRHYQALGLEPPMKTVPVENGEPVANHPGFDPVEIYRFEIQAMIDAKASERQYDSGATLASYVSSTIPRWAAEAQAFLAWRDQVWAYALTELAKVRAGERGQPSVEDFLAGVPAFGWPPNE
ncbi:hypothetical protein ACI2JN_01545 [Ochrobactrum teleogrylli]|uniref:hypothetical protein n=1 Tax=Ochrobactrum teleogrylli TaxID=2479765 RepID=UPI00384B2A34